jgi:hypothetical protein
LKNPRGRSNILGSSHPSSRTLPSLIAVATFVLIIASLYWAQAILIPIARAIMPNALSLAVFEGWLWPTVVPFSSAAETLTAEIVA